MFIYFILTFGGKGFVLYFLILLKNYFFYPNNDKSKERGRIRGA
jgi:hypothetical protein